MNILNIPNYIYQQKIFIKISHRKYTKYDCHYAQHDNYTFGHNFTFSPIDDFCTEKYSKLNAIQCLKQEKGFFDCMYHYCISLSRPRLDYIYIQL